LNRPKNSLLSLGFQHFLNVKPIKVGRAHWENADLKISSVLYSYSSYQLCPKLSKPKVEKFVWRDEELVDPTTKAICEPGLRNRWKSPDNDEVSPR